MARVMITGGSGFVGSCLARELLASGPLPFAGGESSALEQLTLVDRVPPAADLVADRRVVAVTGDLATLLDQRRAAAELAGADVVFHLAAAVSGECEADFDLGLRANLATTQTLLEAIRSAGTHPLLVFSSSVAVYGGSPDHPLPEVVTDDTMPNPQTSYGIQKFVCEQLIADYARKGFLRAHTVRLMTVSVRPGRPNAAASGFMSGIVREPLAGRRTTCPVDPSTRVVLASPANTLRGLLTAATTSDDQWGGRTAVTLPGLSVTVAEMLDAVEAAGGLPARELVDVAPDETIAAMVATWPTRVRTDRAARLGLTPDPDFDSIVTQYQDGLSAS